MNKLICQHIYGLYYNKRPTLKTGVLI